MSSSVTGTMAPSTTLSCSTAVPPILTNMLIRLLAVSITTLVRLLGSAMAGTNPPSVAEPSWVCPVATANVSRKALNSLLRGVALTTAVGTMSAADCLEYPAKVNSPYLLSFTE